jgi:hypothetical protein
MYYPFATDSEREVAANLNCLRGGTGGALSLERSVALSVICCVINCCDFSNASVDVVFKDVLSGRERLETPRALFADGVSKLSTNEFTSAYEETPGVVLHVPFSPATFAAVNGSIELTEVGMGRVSEFKAAISSTFSDGRWPPTLTDLLGFILFDRRLRHFHGRRTRSQNLLVLTDALNARSRGDLALLLAPGISTSRHC